MGFILGTACYRLSELNAQQRQVLDHIDVLIDGKFDQDKADPSLPWRGSHNQLIHSCKV
ncbi:4Fe-4S cluster-binding domain-containing protein [Vibrio injensis]|uniref:4Fe-4S cluster-binding domain-containing protein n=1 Tax=Vibrio injensis TaxID=1307414 RepID=UPI0009FB0A09|nr:4Fe-4S cluster-binding domain-containing protein [Vibrio injensis]